MGALFTVVGFGLIFSFFKRSTASGMTVSIFVFALTLFLNPLLQKWWCNVLLGGFQNFYFTDTTSPRRLLYRSLDSSVISLDFYNLRMVLACSISQLVAMMALFGKLNIVQLILNSVLFNLFWTLNYFVCVLLNTHSPDDRLFDDYQVAMVYLFGGCFALMASLTTLKPPLVEQFSSNKKTSVIAALGGLFLFLSFCTSSSFFSMKYHTSTDTARSLVWAEAFIGVFFALSASTVVTFALSSLLGDRIGVRTLPLPLLLH